MQWTDIFDADTRLPYYVMCGIIIVGIVILLRRVYRFNRREGDVLAKLSGAFRGSASNFGMLFNGNYAGISFRIDFHPPAPFWSWGYTVKYMKVIYSKPFPFPLEISKEHYLSRVGKSLGLPRNIRTGDPAFDSKYIISSPKENEPSVLNFFKSPDKKEAVRNIFALGFQVLKTTDDGLFVELSPYDLWHLTPDTVEHLLRNMEVLYRND